MARQTLQDSEFRLLMQGNITADPTDATGMHFAVVWFDDRNGAAPLPAQGPALHNGNLDTGATGTSRRRSCCAEERAISHEICFTRARVRSPSEVSSPIGSSASTA